MAFHPVKVLSSERRQMCWERLPVIRPMSIKRRQACSFILNLFEQQKPDLLWQENLGQGYRWAQAKVTEAQRKLWLAQNRPHQVPKKSQQVRKWSESPDPLQASQTIRGGFRNLNNFDMLHNRIEERRHKVSLQATLKATSTIKNVSNKSGRFGYFIIISPRLSISWDHAYKEIEYLSLESMNSICVGSNDSQKNIQHILTIHKNKAKNI